jgi:hypothetical protein
VYPVHRTKPLIWRTKAGADGMRPGSVGRILSVARYSVKHE